MPLDSIRALVKTDLTATDRFLIAELESTVPLINQIVEYIVSCGGKRIRPLLVLLSAHAFEHKDNHQVQLAAAIELIHTATLLHDDVVDSAAMRRGKHTANHMWGNEASVLVGDFLYSRAFQLIVRLQNLTVMNIFADATNIIAEGEVLQLINCKNPETTEEAYFDVIARKTGKLFEVSTQMGPAICARSHDEMLAMKDYGMHLGIAYQLIDDVLDYSASTEQMGKSQGNDLSEGKPTLPLIHAMRSGSMAEAKLIRESLMTGAIDKLQDVLAVIESTKAIEYTANAAKRHINKAMLALNMIPDSPYRKAMSDLAEFVVARDH